MLGRFRERWQRVERQAVNYKLSDEDNKGALVVWLWVGGIFLGAYLFHWIGLLD